MCTSGKPRALGGSWWFLEALGDSWVCNKKLRDDPCLAKCVEWLDMSYQCVRLFPLPDPTSYRPMLFCGLVNTTTTTTTMTPPNLFLLFPGLFCLDLFHPTLVNWNKKRDTFSCSPRTKTGSKTWKTRTSWSDVHSKSDLFSWFNFKEVTMVLCTQNNLLRTPDWAQASMLLHVTLSTVHMVDRMCQGV